MYGVRTERRAQLSDWNIMSNSGLYMDVDDVEIAILEENVRTTNEICGDISKQLTMLARLDKQTIVSINPLMNKIYELKIRQKNMHEIEERVSVVRTYASRIRELLDSLDPNLLNSETDIQHYIGSLDGLDAINGQLEKEGLSGFEGLKESLGEGILDGELALKAELMNKLRNAGSGGEPEEQSLQSIRLIYGYLTSGREMSLEDLVVRERINVIKRELTKIRPTKPVLNKDQNYIYDGSGGANGGFPGYSKLIKNILLRETHITKGMFQGLVASGTLNKIIGKILRPITDTYIYELNSIIEFIEGRRLSYNTMYYEISNGVNSLVSWMFENQFEPSDTLQQLSVRCAAEAQNTFRGFFEYIKNRYEEMVVGDGAETLNNTFMLVATRMNKLTVFKEYQLDLLSKMQINEWLPAELPSGFMSEKNVSSDEHFLLSTFYSDIIEYSFYLLASKLKSRRSQEEIGIMLLFNLDGLQNLLEGKSGLKQIIGKRGMERYERLKKKAMDRAVSPWSALTAKVMMASTKQNGQLSMNSKELVKFLDEFNSTFDRLCVELKRKEMPAYFRSQMVSDVTKTLVPSYKIFCASVGGLGSIQKHLKLSPAELSQRLSQLG